MSEIKIKDEEILYKLIEKKFKGVMLNIKLAQKIKVVLDKNPIIDNNTEKNITTYTNIMIEESE